MSHVPSSCELILGVTVVSVQGNQVYLEWTGISGSFGILARPMEFLSSFILRPSPLSDAGAGCKTCCPRIGVSSQRTSWPGSISTEE